MGLQQMLKTANSVKEAVIKAVDALRSVLAQVPAIRLKSITRESRIDHAQLDIVAKLSVAGRGHIGGANPWPMLNGLAVRLK